MKSCGEVAEKEKLISTCYTAYWEAVVPVVVVGRVNVVITEVQVVGVGGIVDRTRPIVCFVAWIVEITVVDIPGPHKP